MSWLEPRLVWKLTPMFFAFAAGACGGGAGGEEELFGNEDICAPSSGCTGCNTPLQQCACEASSNGSSIDTCFPSGTGGAPATGGATGTGGAPPSSTGGTPGAGGAPPPPPGVGGAPPATGGTPGVGGMAGTPGAGGLGGIPGSGGMGGVVGTGGRGLPPPLEPVYRIELRIHRQHSGLDDQQLFERLDEMNWIWWSQAGICFEIHTVTNDATMNTGYDMWFHAGTIPCAPGSNGVYCGNDHDIHTKDFPSLGTAMSPEWDSMFNASRTAAHELGHGLRLNHNNGMPNDRDRLMSSGKQGFMILDFEIQTARGRAAQKALPDTSPIFCAPPDVVPRL